jgi:hypothetical protein
LREVIRPYFLEVQFNIKMRDKMGIPFFDWVTLEKFYELTYNLSRAEEPPTASSMHLSLRKAQELFNLGIPADSCASRTVIPIHCGQHSGDCGQFLMIV